MCLAYCIYLCMFVQNGAIARSIVVTTQTEIIKNFRTMFFLLFCQYYFETGCYKLIKICVYVYITYLMFVCFACIDYIILKKMYRHVVLKNL